MKAALLLILGMVAAAPLAGQTVIRPAPPLDSTRAALRDALLVLRDSLVTIDGAAARLQRDFRNASAPSLLSRAHVMYQACVRSGKAIPSARETVQSTPLTDAHKLERRKDLLTAMDQLEKAVSRCETEFAAMSKPGQGETVRGYANDRAIRVQNALRSYEQALREYFGIMGIRVLPLGVSGTTSG